MEFSKLNGYDVKDKKAIRFYDNISSMKSDNTLKEGMYVKTKGYYSALDGGHGEYIIVDDNTLIEDDSLIHALSNGLFAKLIIENFINIKQFGIKSDGETDDTTAIQYALDYIDSIGGGTLYIPAGTYIIGETIKVPSNTIVKGSGKATILKASNDYDNNNSSATYKSMIILKTNTMATSTGEHDINFIDFTIDNNNQTYAGRNGIFHIRGLKNSYFKNLNINVSGDNVWGMQIYSANKYMTLDTISINNSSTDNSLGGCLWVRTGMAVYTNDDFKSYGINITNCNFESTAKDELVCIADGLANGWTEVNMSNCTIKGQATTTYASAGLIINAVGDDTSIVKANISNVSILGKYNIAGIIAGSSGRNENCTQITLSNINIDLEACDFGIRGYYKVFVTESYIKVPTGKKGVYNTNISNSKLIGYAEASIVNNCDITGNANYGCTNCPVVMNSKVRGNAYAIQTFGHFQARFTNNELIAPTYGIFGNINNSQGLYNSIITDNYIYRPEASSNTGTSGIYITYSDYCVIKNNRVLYTNGTTGNSTGFLYDVTTTNGTHVTKEDNSVIVS